MRTEVQKSGPELSVLVVAYNSAADLKQCLRSVQSSFQSVAHEICVIDNASKDQSAELIARDFPSVRLIRNSKNAGFAAAINQGVRETQAPALFWMNPDSALADGNVQTVLQYLKSNPKTGILGVKIINPDGSLQLSARSFPSYAAAFFNRYSLLSRLFPSNPFTQKYLGTDWDHNEIHPVDWVSGAGLIHRREVIEQLGGLDEGFFMYCEDVDFCKRATDGGWQVIYHPGLTLRHAIAGSSKTARKRMILERHRSIWHYYKKHFKRNPLKDVIIAGSIIIRFAFLWAMAFFKGLLNAFR